MRAHVQAMNEYRGGEMSTEVVVDRNLWTEIVDRRRKWKKFFFNLIIRLFNIIVHYMNELTLEPFD